MDRSVFDHIVPGGLCIGCGICAGFYPSDIRMIIDRHGWYIPEALNGDVGRWGKGSLAVCPFSDSTDNEDVIAGRLFGSEPSMAHRPETGYFLECSACHVSDDEARMSSSSGGLATWLTLKLLESGDVQGAVCVRPSDRGDRLFEFDIMTSPADIRRSSKSRYYPVEMSDVIGRLRRFEGKVVMIGLPCFIKAVRLACATDGELAGRVRYTIGLFCGHLKSMRYVDYLARSCGVDEKDVVTIDFRGKIEGRRASDYGIEITCREGEKTSRRNIRAREVWGGSWTNNLFMLPACECCDDVFSETADIAIGDAWLPEYVSDWKGTNIAVCRSSEIARIMREGARSGEIDMDGIPVEKVMRSQAGALRQRREGLQYRLYLARRRGVHRPVKRVEPKRDAGTFLDRMLQRQRMKIAAATHEAFLEQLQEKGLGLFRRRLRRRIFLSGCVNQLRHLPSAVRHKIGKLAG
jgi:coenzyme F420 hydrogenase subunit beta